MLAQILKQDEYALALAPGFFRFYAHIGVLHGLEELGCLNVSHVTGCSAGALVAGFLAAGMKPSAMAAAVMPITREDVWDVGGMGGLLKGERFLELIEKHLPRKSFEEAIMPCGMTAFDMVRLRTKMITSGSLALAARASCTFPGLFQPVIIDGTPHIDGGVWDGYGLMALEDCFKVGERRRRETTGEATSVEKEDEFRPPDNKLIVNVVYDRAGASKLPEKFSNCRLLTIVMENIPMVSPFSMQTAGPLAYNLAKTATIRALYSSHIQEVSSKHWCCYIDGNLVLDFVRGQLDLQRHEHSEVAISEKCTSSTMMMPPPQSHSEGMKQRSVSMSSIQSNHTDRLERTSSISSVNTEPLVEGVSVDQLHTSSSSSNSSNNNSSTHDNDDTRLVSSESIIGIKSNRKKSHSNASMTSISSSSSSDCDVTTVKTEEQPQQQQRNDQKIDVEVTTKTTTATTAPTPTSTNSNNNNNKNNNNNLHNSLSVLTHIPFHLPHLPLPQVPDLTTSMREMMAIPSYSFINGTYYYLSHSLSESSSILLKSMSDTIQQLGTSTTVTTTSSSHNRNNGSESDSAGDSNSRAADQVANRTSSSSHLSPLKRGKESLDMSSAEDLSSENDVEEDTASKRPRLSEQSFDHYDGLSTAPIKVRASVNQEN